MTKPKRIKAKKNLIKTQIVQLKQPQSMKMQNQDLKSNRRNFSPDLNTNKIDNRLRQLKVKNAYSNVDIDIYFAQCIKSTKKRVQEILQGQAQYSKKQALQKEKEPAINKTAQKKQEPQKEGQQMANSSLQRILQHNFDDNQDSERESPIFGREQMNKLLTPLNKLQQYKVYEHSQELIKRDLMDQLEQGSKISSIFQHQSNVVRFKSQSSSPRSQNQKKRIKRNRRLSHRNRSEDRHASQDQRVFSFRRTTTSHYEDKLRRIAQVHSLPALGKMNTSYEKALRLLSMVSNGLKNVMNYYKLRQLSPQLLAYRNNLERALKQELWRISNCLTTKKEICLRTIHQKIKLNESEKDPSVNQRDPFGDERDPFGNEKNSFANEKQHYHKSLKYE